MPNQPVRDQLEFPTKMERHFPIKPGQPIGSTPEVCVKSSKSDWPRIRDEYSAHTQKIGLVPRKQIRGDLKAYLAIGIILNNTY